jgi:hypothetical protein
MLKAFAASRWRFITFSDRVPGGCALRPRPMTPSIPFLLGGYRPKAHLVMLVVCSYTSGSGLKTLAAEIRMTTRRLTIVTMMAIAFALTSGNQAQARSPFDGYWSVAVSGQSGSCRGGTYQYALQIVNGIIRYPGSDARITGRVTPGGAVYVRVWTSDRSAAGSGRLWRNFGGGAFRARSSSGMCAGSWSARRMGG